MHTTNFKWQQKTAAEDRAERKKDERRKEQEIYRAVNVRDKRKCRICKKSEFYMHHHHIVYRSKGGEHTLENVLLLCGKCHSQVHKGQVHLEGDSNQQDEAGLYACVVLSQLTDAGWKKERLI